MIQAICEYREKEIAKLEKENAELKERIKWYSEQICNKECAEVWGELSKAKKIVGNLYAICKDNHYPNSSVLMEQAEQFLKKQMTDEEMAMYYESAHGSVPSQWHDLRKNPDDLPPLERGAEFVSIDVLIDRGEIAYCYHGKDYWCDCNGNKIDTPRAWCEIPRFEGGVNYV